MVDILQVFGTFLGVLVGVSFFYSIYFFYTAETTNGVNIDCPNQVALDAIKFYNKRVSSGSDCMMACRAYADYLNQDVHCRCPTSKNDYCLENIVSPTQVISVKSDWVSING